MEIHTGNKAEVKYGLKKPKANKEDASVLPFKPQRLYMWLIINY